MTKTPRQRVESLLKIHGGHCFIVQTCEDFDALATAAREMQGEGICTVKPSCGIVQGLDVKRKGYRPQRMPIDLQETPAH